MASVNIPFIYRCQKILLTKSIFRTFSYYPTSKCASLIQLSYSQPPIRFYAKGKDRKKETKHKHITINENLLSQAIDVQLLHEEFDYLLEKMRADFVKHLSLRSSIGALDELLVEHEGAQYSLHDLAQIGKKNPSTYVVSFALFPQVIPDVLKAIQNSGLGLNPQQDGTTLFIPVPKVTKEHRETLAKNAKAMFIRTRDNIKDVQTKYIKKVKNTEGLSEDAIFAIKEQITVMADGKIAEADSILKSKQDELTSTS